MHFSTITGSNELTRIFLAGCLLLSCSSTKNNVTVQAEKSNAATTVQQVFDKQGHRGCRGLMPENTIPAMVNAAGMWVTTLEMDVCISKDKKVFLSHEPYFSQEITTKPDGSYIDKNEERSFNTYLMNYDDIAKYDVGMKPHPRFPDQQKMKAVKPLLSEVFNSINEFMMTARRPPLFYNIEIKSMPQGDNLYHPEPAEFVELVMAVVKAHQLEEQVIIQSFDFRPLKYLHKQYPNIKTAMLIEGSNKNNIHQQVKDLGFTPTAYSPEFNLVTPALVNICHEMNMKIIPWTVNEKSDIERLKKMGVDGIITDYPNLFDN